MGPDSDLSDMSSANKALSLPKLWGNSSNWATYSKRILNYMTSKGYRQHVQGTVHKLETLNERDGAFYKSGSLAPLSNGELDKHEELTDLYNQMQAAVWEIIYCTVDKTTFLQIKNEADAASVWKKVASIHAEKGILFEANLLVQLQNMCYDGKESMREHIGKMMEIREGLAEMNTPITNESFILYLWTSLSLTPSFCNLFTTLSTTSRQTGKKLTSADVIWHLTKEVASVELRITSINPMPQWLHQHWSLKREKGRIRIIPSQIPWKKTYYAWINIVERRVIPVISVGIKEGGKKARHPSGGRNSLKTRKPVWM